MVKLLIHRCTAHLQIFTNLKPRHIHLAIRGESIRDIAIRIKQNVWKTMYLNHGVNDHSQMPHVSAGVYWRGLCLLSSKSLDYRRTYVPLNGQSVFYWRFVFYLGAPHKNVVSKHVMTVIAKLVQRLQLHECICNKISDKLFLFQRNFDTSAQNPFTIHTAFP